MEDIVISPTKMSLAAEEAAGVMRALANPSRLLILCQLADGEKSVGELEDALDLGQAYVSQQLARLREERLVVARRDGRQMMYSVADVRVLHVIQTLYDQYCR